MENFTGAMIMLAARLKRLGRLRVLGVLGVLRVLGVLLVMAHAAGAQTPPDYHVDATWPQPLPAQQILGQVSGIAVAPDDTIWVLHRPKSMSADDLGAVQNPPISSCCTPAPSVLQFSQSGELLQSWGGPVWDREKQQWQQPVSDWPANEHGIFVDGEGFVWIGGNQDAGGRHIVVKYSPTGEHLLTIGIPGETGGSNDTARLGRPADIAVDVQAREAYIADGYRNRRVVVFDSENGQYKRHWGAYGNRPDDSPLPAYDPGATEYPEQFLGPVHAVVQGPDDLVYVADRTGNRIQVFEKNGTFVREALIAPDTLSSGSAWDLAFSPLDDGRWLFVADGGNRVIWRLDRNTLTVRGSFGGGGRQAGLFDWVHNIAADRSGNLYTAEVNNGRRIQKFVPIPEAR